MNNETPLAVDHSRIKELAAKFDARLGKRKCRLGLIELYKRIFLDNESKDAVSEDAGISRQALYSIEMRHFKMLPGWRDGQARRCERLRARQRAVREARAQARRTRKTPMSQLVEDGFRVCIIREAKASDRTGELYGRYACKEKELRGLKGLDIRTRVENRQHVRFKLPSKILRQLANSKGRVTLRIPLRKLVRVHGCGPPPKINLWNYQVPDVASDFPA